MLKAELSGGVLRITHHAPEVGNAFSPSDAKELEKILKSSSEARVLIWTHQSKTPFCNGGNLKFYAKQSRRPAGISANRGIAKALSLLESAPCLTIAHVRGDCWGGGLELLGSFDYVISEPQSFFGLWQRRIGLMFGWGGGRRLFNRLGHHRLRQLARLSESVSSFEALRLGIIDEIRSSHSVSERIDQLVVQELQLSEASGKAAKQWSPTKEQALFERLWWGRPHLEALTKFGFKKR